MSKNNEQRNSEEIEKDINQSRSRLDSTLHEIETRFSPQQMLNTSYEYLRHGGANEFFANLGTTIKQNPLPFLVTSAGLGWMMLSQRYPNQGQPQSQTHNSPSIPVHEGTQPDGDGSGVAPNQSGSSDTHDAGQGHLKGMADGAKEKAHHLGERAHHLGDSVRESTSHLQHGAQSSMHDMSNRARQVKSQSSDFIQEHPLVVGALGFALGAALGGIFPATKKEDEYFGEYRDRVLHKAAETGQEEADKAQHKIHEKAESVKSQSQQDSDTNVKSSPTPSTERPDTERHSSGLAGSNTPSGNTQGSGTNRTPLTASEEKTMTQQTPENDKQAPKKHHDEANPMPDTHHVNPKSKDSPQTPGKDKK
ncbi:MAG: DUF3618 domain-containing protein [Halomonas sp.]|nr:DUF3618 domain-containing protein [Halomonas sp.]